MLSFLCSCSFFFRFLSFFSFYFLLASSTSCAVRVKPSRNFTPMECLYTDSDGVVPTSGWECMVAGEWIALNVSTGKIPSTEVFQQALED